MNTCAFCDNKNKTVRRINGNPSCSNCWGRWRYEVDPRFRKKCLAKSKRFYEKKKSLLYEKSLNQSKGKK